MPELRIFIIFLSFIVSVKPYTLKMTMPGVTPSNSDEYICSPFPVPMANRETFIIGYEPLANSSVAHHMLLYGCSSPYSTESSFNCHSICERSRDNILFAWAKDAQKFEFPFDTGMAVGGGTNINYFVLQIHYLKPSQVKDHSGLILTLTEERPQFVVGIMLLFSYYGDIPPNSRKSYLDISCKYKGNVEAYSLGFRTHAHALGRLISGFRVSEQNGEINLIGQANPQWPQTFYKAHQVLIKPGDILMARCVYNSLGRDSVTSIGSSHSDEMCNFYIMMVTRNIGETNNFMSCGGNEFKELWKNIPKYSMDYGSENPSPNLLFSNSSLNKYGNDFVQLAADENWKIQARLGEVSGVSILYQQSANPSFSLLVLHRGSHKWTETTFVANVYQEDHSNPISDSTILEIEVSTGKVLREAGRNIFFLPHGITVTKDGRYLWITDVALHQVMRFTVKKDSNLIDDKPNIVLGEKFVPGSDRYHFCKPTKVAIDSRGNIFVADGYCNSRIVCFSPNGTFIEEWRSDSLQTIVHSITIEEDKSGDITKNVVWVADRENRKIIGFNYDGTVKFGLSNMRFPLPVYGIEYNPNNQLLYGITSNGNDGGNSFTFNTSTLSKQNNWHANYSLEVPHDFCLANNGTIIFVAELHLKRVLKFLMDKSLVNNPSLIIKKFTEIHNIVRNNYPALIGVSLIIPIAILILCFIGKKYRRYFVSRNGKVRRYGHVYNDKEGFRPLTQNDEDNDDGNSDPEAEEYSTPRGHPLRKPKA